MRILALSDIHNSYSTAEKIIASETAYELIIICGDITTHGSSAEAEEAIKQFQKSGKPVMAIAGNMDSPEIDEALLKMGISINGKGIIIKEIGFFGVSAAPVSQLHTPYEISEDSILEKAEAGWKDVKTARWKVFVPHAPPFNTNVDKIFNGKHVGSAAVKTFIDQHQPDAVICGHIHEARGIDSLGSTKIINCGPAANGNYAIIEIGWSILLENRG